MREIATIYKVLIFALAIIILFVIGIFIFIPPGAKWERASQVYMDDFNGDGKKQEMLMIYEPCDQKMRTPCENKSAMRLVNIETEKEIWTSFSKRSVVQGAKRIAIIDNVLTIAYLDEDNYTINEPSLGVEAFNCKTGDKLWDYSLDTIRDFSHEAWLVKYEKDLFVLSEIRPDSIYITCLDINNGKKKWEVSINSKYLESTPDFIKNKILISTRECLYIINLQLGIVDTIKNSNWHKLVFTNKDNSFLYLHDSKFIKYDTIPNVIKDFSLANASYKSVLRFDEASLYKDNFIFFSGNRENSNLISFPIYGNKEIKTFEFDKGLRINRSELIFDKKLSGFHKIYDRFIPVILNKVRDSLKIQLAVFDLDKNQVYQKGKFINPFDRHFAMNRIFYYRNHYVMIMSQLFYDNWIVSISAKTGKLKKAIRFQYDENRALPIFWYGSEMFADNYFYGSTAKQTWCLSYPNLELVFSENTDLKVIDAKAEIEELFGEMEWE